MIIGSNQQPCKEWTPQLVFKDLMKEARAQGDTHEFVYQAGGSWLMLRGFQHAYRRCYVHKSGDMDIRISKYGVLQGGSSEGIGGDFWITLDPDSHDGVLLEVLRVGAGPHEVAIIPEEFLGDDVEAHPFHPTLLDFHRAHGGPIRCMDWLRANWSKVRVSQPGDWERRVTPKHITQTTDQGIAHEYLAMLSTELNQPLHITIPHGASDEYIAKLAAFYKANTPEDLWHHFATSNEIWNNQFSQKFYFEELGTRLFDPRMNDGSPDVFKARLWGQAYETARMATLIGAYVPVLEVQHANTWTGTTPLKFDQLQGLGFQDETGEGPWTLADVLAEGGGSVSIAPYFGGRLGDKRNLDKGRLPKATHDMTVDEVLDHCLEDIVRLRGITQRWKAIADEHELMLDVYECGPHMIAIAGWSSGPATDAILLARINDLFLEANSHPRMFATMLIYFEGLKLDGVRTACQFTGPGVNWGPRGYWSIYPHYLFPSGPKWEGLLEAIRLHTNPPDEPEDPPMTTEIRKFPLQVSDGVHGSAPFDVEVEVDLETAPPAPTVAITGQRPVVKLDGTLYRAGEPVVIRYADLHIDVTGEVGPLLLVPGAVEGYTLEVNTDGQSVTYTPIAA